MATVNAPPLWMNFANSILASTILAYGAIKYQALVAFCQSTNVSGSYGVVKAMLIIMLYAYLPIWAISVTFCWVSYDKDWSSGYAFVVLPFADVFLFLVTVMVTRNDVSSFIDAQRDARTKLPEQNALPQIMVVTTDPSNVSYRANAAPPLPVRDEDL